jgi:2-C-methyl-D-erythritol 2,4-cyclodiphosphate synthase
VIFRIGLGHDIHPLTGLSEGRPLVLGGVIIPGERGLAGHSDADVIVHSVCDALLGALALGDLGRHFPDTDPRYRDLSSLELLRSVVSMISERSWHPVNLDLSVVAEAPRLAPFMERMREKIGEVLGLPVDAVSIKAVRPEGLGALGRAEGIASTAVVLVSRDPEAREQP